MHLEAFISAPPFLVTWDEIEDFSSLGDRIALMNSIFPNAVGVGSDFVEWLPESEEPLVQEKLLWLWVFKPSAQDKILDFADDTRIPEIRKWLVDGF